MPATISLSQFLATLQFSDPTAVLYFDRATGRIVEANRPKIPDSERESACFQPLPIFTEQDEIELARQFSAAAEKSEDRQRLNLALSSANPQEAFQTALFRCQIANEWFQFRDKHLLRLAKNWLDAQGVAYIDDVARQAD
jgi:hypothetical protein